MLTKDPNIDLARNLQVCVYIHICLPTVLFCACIEIYITCTQREMRERGGYINVEGCSWFSGRNLWKISIGY